MSTATARQTAPAAPRYRILSRRPPGHRPEADHAALRAFRHARGIRCLPPRRRPPGSEAGVPSPVGGTPSCDPGARDKVTVAHALAC